MHLHLSWMRIYFSPSHTQNIKLIPFWMWLQNALLTTLDLMPTMYGSQFLSKLKVVGIISLILNMRGRQRLQLVLYCWRPNRRPGLVLKMENQFFITIKILPVQRAYICCQNVMSEKVMEVFSVIRLRDHVVGQRLTILFRLRLTIIKCWRVGMIMSRRSGLPHF